MMRRPSLRTVAWLALAALLLGSVSACASIPGNGQVQRLADDNADDGTPVRYRPTGPDAGASPDDIVNGYFDAMLAFPVDTQVVGQYLTTDAAASWQSSAGISVYSGALTVLSSAQTDSTWTVTVGLQQVAFIDAQGRYSAHSAQVNSTLTLAQVDGEWRLANPLAGLWVSEAWFRDSMRPQSLYFLNSSGQHVAAVPVWVVAGDQMATSLIVNLVAGREPSDNPSLTTVVPNQVRASVPIDSDGIAEVSFPVSPDIAESVQEQLIAQVAWTLSDVPGVTGVRVLAGDAVLAPRGRKSQTLDTWDDFTPVPQRNLAALRGNKVVLVDKSRITTMAGQWGRDASGATAIGLGKQDIATLIGNEAVVTDLAGSAERRIPGTSWLPPVIDVNGSVWLPDLANSSVRIRVLTSAGTLQDVDASAIAGPVSAWEPSPDGTRYAFVRNGALQVGQIIASANGWVLGTPTQLGFSVAGPVSGFTWLDNTVVTSIVGPNGGQKVISERVDGSQESVPTPSSKAALDVETPSAVQAIDGTTLYLLDAQGQLWRLKGQSWQKVGATQDSAVTAIG
jgi:hypothetical protein